MRTRTALAASAALLVAGGSLAPALAGPPKGFSKTVAFTDATPDPSGNAASDEANHCRGKLPMEAPIALKIPGPGMVTVTLGGFQGDWTLMVTDAADETIAGADVNPPGYEEVEFRLKKAQTINLRGCNLAGTPNGTITYKYVYKK